MGNALIRAVLGSSMFGTIELTTGQLMFRWESHRRVETPYYNGSSQNKAPPDL